MSIPESVNYLNDSTDLNEDNFILFAAQNYENKSCYDIEEFNNDLLITMHIKKLFTRYHTKDDLKERLILNHIICFFNVFNPISACKILFFKIDEKYHIYLKTCLTYLNRCPKYLYINGELLNVKLIPLDNKLLEKFREAEND